MATTVPQKVPSNILLTLWLMTQLTKGRRNASVLTLKDIELHYELCVEMLKCCLYPEAGKAGRRKDARWGEGGVSHCSLFAAFVPTLAIKTKLLRKMKEGGEIGTLCGHNTHFYLHGSFIVLVRTELGEAECWGGDNGTTAQRLWWSFYSNLKQFMKYECWG